MNFKDGWLIYLLDRYIGGPHFAGHSSPYPNAKPVCDTPGSSFQVWRAFEHTDNHADRLYCLAGKWALGRLQTIISTIDSMRVLLIVKKDTCSHHILQQELHWFYVTCEYWAPSWGTKQI